MIARALETFGGSQAYASSINAARQTDFETGIDEINQPAFLAQIAIQAGRVKTAAEDVVAELQRVIIGVGAGELQAFGEGHFVLHAAGVGHVRDGNGIVRHGREQGVRFFAFRLPGAEIF